MSHYDEMEQLLAQLLTALTPVFSEAERGEVQHYIDYREYGLALETAVDIFHEQKKTPPAGVAELVQGLATAMEMDVARLLEQLAPAD